MKGFGNSNLDNYVNRQVVGKGSFGFVYKCKDKNTNETVAMKRVSLEMESQGFPSTAIREISLLREVEHHNIVELKNVVIQQGKLYLIFEYLESDLKLYIDSMDRNEVIPPRKIKQIMHAILSGIAACHERNFIHRDLKPANILLGFNGKIKIADFGLARSIANFNRPYTDEVVTLWYRAPEILLRSHQYEQPADLWSVGCIFAELITKRITFQGDSEIDQLCRMFRALGTPNEKTWPGISSFSVFKGFAKHDQSSVESLLFGYEIDLDGLDLLDKLLKYDPKQRITAQQALQHGYFANMER